MANLVTSTMKEGEGEAVNITDSNLPPYLSYSATYSDGKKIEKNHYLKAGESETYKVRIEFKKDITATQLPGAEKSFTFNFQVDYVQADDNAVEVGEQPVSFTTDDWGTIIRAVKKGNTSTYTVGSEKEVDLGAFGKHKVRVANNSTPTECSTEGVSQTACGFVLEFTDVITTHQMNPYTDASTNGDGNKGGWEYCEMRNYVNNDIYNSLPTVLKNAIINTKVVSGHGSDDSNNFTTTDKLYLLSTKELWGKEGTSNTISKDSAESETRQLDYYKSQGISTSNFGGAEKKSGSENAYWWTRTAYSTRNNQFFAVLYAGDWDGIISTNIYGISPAFRIG